MNNCWKCNGTGSFGGVDDTLYECDHPPDTRKYTDKGYLIMGNTNKYDEAKKWLDGFVKAWDLTGNIRAMKQIEIICESLEKAKDLDEMVEARKKTTRGEWDASYFEGDADAEFIALCANLTEKYIKEE